MTSRTGIAARVAGLGALIVAAALLSAALAAPPRLAAHLTELRQLWFLSALAVALVVFGLCLWRGMGRFGLVAALVLTGGAAQLYLTDPLWFPLPPLRPSGLWELAMVALIAAEALAALAVLIAVGPLSTARDAVRSVGALPLVLLAVVTVFLSVSVMRHAHNSDWTGYALRLGTGGALTAVHLAAIWALSLLRAPVTTVPRLPGWIAPSLAFSATLITCWTGFERLPHVEDEYAYLFRAATYASGALHFPAPPDAAMPGLVYYLEPARLPGRCADLPDRRRRTRQAGRSGDPRGLSGAAGCALCVAVAAGSATSRRAVVRETCRADATLRRSSARCRAGSESRR